VACALCQSPPVYTPGMRASADGSDDRTASARTAEKASSDGIVAPEAIVVAPGVVRTDSRSEQSRKAKGAGAVATGEWCWRRNGEGVFMERRRHEADQIMACFAAGVIYAAA
jgi:hypothetical protein